METAQSQIEALRELEKSRSSHDVEESLKRVRDVAGERKENLTPYMIDAVNTYATFGEIMGTVREAFGYVYDPLQE